MTRLRLSFFIWLCFFLCFLLIDEKHRGDTLAVKNKLLRREIVNRQWEVNQAHSRNRELDAKRWFWRATTLRHTEWAQIIETIYRKSNEYGLRPDLMLAVAHRESNFSPLAESAYAVGVMQINYSVWAETLGLNMTTIFDIENNIDAGCLIMRMYLTETGGDEIRALELYNAGYLLNNPRYVPRIQSSKFYGGVK